MLDMLAHEEDKALDEGRLFQTRPCRYTWYKLQSNPYISQATGDALRGYDVVWIWKREGFYLRIWGNNGAKTLFFAQIPNWQRAEIEDVIDGLLSVIKKAGN